MGFGNSQQAERHEAHGNSGLKGGKLVSFILGAILLIAAIAFFAFGETGDNEALYWGRYVVAIIGVVLIWAGIRRK